MVQGISQADPAAIIYTNKVSEVLWNRPDHRAWGQYGADMATKLTINTLACRADAKEKFNGWDSTVTGLYRIWGVDWLVAEEELLPP